MMPHLNGLEVCEAYKKQSQSPAPVIFLSAKTHGDIIEKFTTIGEGFIQKPFDPTELCPRINEILEKR